MLVIAAVALAGCGSDAGRPEAAPRAPVFDPQRTQDFVPLTTAQVTRKARRIVLAVARGSRVVEGAPGTPFTRTTFEAEDVIKGALPHRFVLQVIGGQLGDRYVTSPVQPFTPSRRYVLFLGRDGPAGPTIYPQSVLEVTPANAARVLAEIRRHLSTEGSP